MKQSGWNKGGKDAKVKLLKILLVRCQKSREELEFERLTWVIDERVYIKLEDKLSMITGRNI